MWLAFYIDMTDDPIIIKSQVSQSPITPKWFEIKIQIKNGMICDFFQLPIKSFQTKKLSLNGISPPLPFPAAAGSYTVESSYAFLPSILPSLLPFRAVIARFWGLWSSPLLGKERNESLRKSPHSRKLGGAGEGGGSEGHWLLHGGAHRQIYGRRRIKNSCPIPN